MAPSDLAVSLATLPSALFTTSPAVASLQAFGETSPVYGATSTASVQADTAAKDASSIVITIGPVSARPRSDDGHLPQAANEIIVASPKSEVPGEKEGSPQTRMEMVITASQDAAVGKTQAASLNISAMPPAPSIAGSSVASTAEARPGTETDFVNGLSTARVPDTLTPSSASVPPAGVPTQSQSTPQALPDAPSVTGATESIPNSVEIAPRAGSVQVGVSSTWSGTITLSPSSPVEHFIAGKTGSSTVGEKDIGLAATPGQRKALALGLRYLYPSLTDDEIAQAAGVSRRTLFRWEEYVMIKKAQRQVYKRPRGFKDRRGNLEAWSEDNE